MIQWEEKSKGCYRTTIGGARITVHPRVGLKGWFVTSHEFLCLNEPLLSTDIEFAKVEALQAVARYVQHYADAFRAEGLVT